jgi:hypothetical protein
MAEWRDVVNRGMAVLESDGSDAARRTVSILNHVANEANRDEYISRDFFNVQQTAGGLPEGISFPDFVGMIAGHVRPELTMSSFDGAVSDEDLRSALLTFDANITRHIRFLNGVVHQIAAGEVHLALWQLILNARSDSSSIYGCYRDYLVDA